MDESLGAGQRDTQTLVAIIKPVTCIMRDTLKLIGSICLYVSICAAADSGRQNCSPPLWTADVISELSWARKLPSSSLTDSNRTGLTFVDEDTLLIYQIEVDTAELSSRQSPVISSSYKLQMSVFDLVSGRMTASEKLPTWIHASSVQAASGGALVRTGNILRLYSKHLIKMQEAVLPPLGQDESDTIMVSASRNTVLSNRNNGNYSHFDVLDGGNLKLMQSWSEFPPLRRLYSISDTEIAASDFNQEHILIADFATSRWRVIAGKPSLQCVGLPTLVTNTTLVTSCRPFSYLSTEGTIIFQDSFGKNESLEQKAAVAQRGTAVAVSLNRRRGSDFLDTLRALQIVARYVIVYNLALKKRSLTFELKPLPANDLDYALSPDGSKLAILSDRHVTVCAVP